ncbi:MAG: hydratase [Prevotellaceae bacterium]|jgi:aconitate hydratase|nr:hydratase [Prevotellaceae bacterium]
MIRLIKNGVYLLNGKDVVNPKEGMPATSEAREKTITYTILRQHNRSHDKTKMQIGFDALMSHDITYVGIIQTARASGLKEFPIPYAMTNCHNSLCAVGGTINEDDHVFGLSAAKKYGGIYIPANQAVIHQYAREAIVKCGAMVLGSDSHTRYGSLGCMGVGEGGGELVKQLLSNTWDINAPEVILVWLEGNVKKGVGPHDIAMSMVKAVFDNGFVKNKVLEFAGPGVKNLPIDFRNGIDIMTTETTCLSSIWITDDVVKEHYDTHLRSGDYKELKPGDIAWYDGMISIDLSTEEAMIALPFHPSNAFTIKELNENPMDIIKKVEKDAKELFGDQIDFDLANKIVNGKIVADQGIIAGCAGGTYDNLCAAGAILNDRSIGNNYFTMSAYPQSTPVYMAITRNGITEKLLEAGVVVKPAFCGPCFGAGDVPSNNGLSIRHTTRNFPNREGSKPNQGQISSVALMDARSIAATAANGGALTPATDMEYDNRHGKYIFDGKIYEKRVYQGFGKANPQEELKFGPNITDWPKMYAMEENMLLELAAVIRDAVTTTDELIPSGETSSYRSNPLKLAEFTLSRRVPEYVGLSRRIKAQDMERREKNAPQNILDVLAKVGNADELVKNTSFGSCVFANKPGDGSAREQAASCQKVLGGDANICYEYATKRYRSNCINWGIVPFTIASETTFNCQAGDYVFVSGIKQAIENGIEEIPAKIINGNNVTDITLFAKNLTTEERTILSNGCLMNYYAIKNQNN